MLKVNECQDSSDYADRM